MAAGRRGRAGSPQGAAIQAYARQSAHNPAWADVARAGLRVYELPPPSGVRINTPAGAHYLIYSFAPRMRVINAFVYALIGLHDVATTLGDGRAQSLFEAGDAEARLELPRYDTGAWSLYDGVTESNLGYHQLLQGFLVDLCRRAPVAVYCDTASRFAAYEHQAPRISLLTNACARAAPRHCGSHSRRSPSSRSPAAAPARSSTPGAASSGTGRARSPSGRAWPGGSRSP